MVVNLAAITKPEDALTYLDLVKVKKRLYFSEEGTGRLGTDFNLLPGLLARIGKNWLKKLLPEDAAIRLVAIASSLAKSKNSRRLLYLISRANKKVLPFEQLDVLPEVLIYAVQEHLYPDDAKIGEEMWDYILGKNIRCKYPRCGQPIPVKSRSNLYCSSRCQELNTAENVNNCTVLRLGSSLESKVRCCNSCYDRFWSYNFGHRTCSRCSESIREMRLSPRANPVSIDAPTLKAALEDTVDY